MEWNCGLFLVEIPRSKIQIFDFQLITKSSVASSCHGAALSQSDGKTQYVLFGKWWVFTDKLYFFWSVLAVERPTFRTTSSVTRRVNENVRKCVCSSHARTFETFWRIQTYWSRLNNIGGTALMMV